MELKDFFEAKQRLQGVIHKIPLEYTKHFSDITGATVYMKCENRQKTGSFKVRGAYNKIAKLASTGKVKAVVACSAGNHAQGVAYSATCAGIKSTIVMPTRAPAVKVSATKSYGAEVVLHGDTYDDAFIHAKELEQKTGAVYVPGFDDDDIIIGAGTIGLEILEELLNVDTIIIPAGGGGLLAGIAYCVKNINPKIRIIGVQASGATAIYNSYKTGKLTPSQNVSTFADGIAVKTPGTKPFEIIKKYVDDVVTVTDDETAEVIVALLERCKQVVEPSGAVALTAIATGKVDVRGQNVVCLVSGGNLDLELVSNLIQKSLQKRK